MNSWSERGKDGPAIVFRDAGKRFGDTWVLEHIDIELPPGTILGLIGPSGCGKTTTVRLATGFYRPDAGEVETLGTNPSELSKSERTELGYLPQHAVLFDDLSLRDNLNFHASLNGVPFRRGKRLDDLLELVELEGQDGKLVRAASGGMQRRLALAATLVHDPRLLMLDEPTAGIDPILRRKFWEHFRSLRDSGTTLVISTQYVGEAADCDVVAMLAEGHVVAFDTPKELFRQAHGGALFDVDFTSDVRAEAVRKLDATEDFVDAIRIEDRTVRITSNLDDAEVQRICAERLTDYEVSSLTLVPPDWDEVFIRLVDAHGTDDEPSGDDEDQTDNDPSSEEHDDQPSGDDYHEDETSDNDKPAGDAR